MAMAFKKGDRIDVKSDGTMKTGTVIRGGSRRITALLDGGEYEVSGPPAAFRRSSTPPPTEPPLPTDRWGIAAYRSAGGEETERFECKITLDGRPVILADNGGTGGPNAYHPLPGQQHDVVKQLRADVAAAAEMAGSKWRTDVTDLWVAWKKHLSKAQTFRAYITANAD